ncbi:MAG: hypothetical protein ACFB22_14290 [Rhodothalassiaceae bacterium]
MSELADPAVAPAAAAQDQTDTGALRRLLERARWAPSGDNEQPWRFELLGGDRIRVHVQYTPGTNIYEFADGRPTWIAIGCLLESLRLAASQEGRGCRWEAVDQDARIIEVDVSRDASVRPDPLAEQIERRSVDRRAYRRTALTSEQKAAIEAAAGPAFRFQWYESVQEKFAASRLAARATWIRLRIPECHQVHAKVLRFDDAMTPFGLPVQATGVNAMLHPALRWATKTWPRSRLMNRWLGGALLASAEIDYWAGLNAAAHFVALWRADHADRPRTDWILAGIAKQRVWLTITALGLAYQPAWAPVIFSHWAETRDHRWQLPATQAEGQALSAALRRVYAAGPDDVVFLGRTGQPKRPLTSRSTRLPLDQLMA